ncbi:uncharacterized protein LOC141591009 [Silene latifolia]|uniref:uncharacterized protein LOC141591009 n=1 Tax=Silene latifolia TaxID=37657 RepID=UPI003D782A0F
MLCVICILKYCTSLFRYFPMQSVLAKPSPGLSDENIYELFEARVKMELQLFPGIDITSIALIDALGRFLGENPKTSDSSNVVLAMDLIVAKLSWRNNYNVDDCGIYTMRHMETFMGLISWKCGLMKNDRSVLKVLRYKYLCTLLMFDHNDCRETVADHAKKGHFSKASDYI